jgi:hypothetical protein
MKKYDIELNVRADTRSSGWGKQNKTVILKGVECSCSDGAYDFANALADSMPSNTYYCGKNDCDIEDEWWGKAGLSAGGK